MTYSPPSAHQFRATLNYRKKSWPFYKESLHSRLTRWRRRKLRSLSEAQNHRCAYCGKQTHFGNSTCKDRATLEHFIPVCTPVQTNKDENLIMACAHCNSLRRDMDPIKFYNKIRCKPLSIFLEKKEPKFSKDPIKLTKQRIKQGRLLETCWVMINCWPENAQAIINYRPPCEMRKSYDQHINEIRQRLYEYLES